MRILLDTCTFLWIITGSKQLSRLVSSQFRNPANAVYLSVISEWEIAIKYALNRLPIPGNLQTYIPVQRKKHGITSLPLVEKSVLKIVQLPPIHKGFFDRMLVSQALFHNLAILSPDTDIRQYEVKVLW